MSWGESLDSQLRRDREQSEERRLNIAGDDDEVDHGIPPLSPSISSTSAASNSTSKKRKAVAEVERRSAVYKHWRHDPKTAHFYCNYCKKKYGDTNSSTPLNNHLMDAHRSIMEGVKEAERVPKCFQPNLKDNEIPKLTKKEQEEIDQKLKRLIINCNLPFFMVDYKEFVNFVRALNPSYEVPTRNTLKAWLFDDY